MPSGTGGGGSHNGGGSHFNRGTSSSTSSSHHTSRVRGGFTWWYTRPRVVIIGGRRYYSRPTKTGGALAFVFSFLMVIAFFALMFGLIFFMNGNSTVQYIKDDYIHYHQMIADAETNPSLVRTATITQHGYNPTAEKWYFNYEIDLDVGYGKLKGYTYSVYSQEQISSPKYAVGAEIQVAVNNLTVSSSTDSVPLDFKDFNVEDDGEYTHYLQNKNIGVGVLIGAGIAMAVVVVASVIVNKKARELSPANESAPTASTPSTNAGSPSTQTNTNTNQEKYNDEITYCPYCGERITKGAKKCPKCKADL